MMTSRRDLWIETAFWAILGVIGAVSLLFYRTRLHSLVFALFLVPFGVRVFLGLRARWRSEREIG
jgi:uncharacterized membrane protein YfcA